MKKLNICVDIDGTINNYAAVVAPLTLVEFGVPIDTTNYNIFGGLSHAELAEFHARHAELMVTDIKPLPGAVDALRYLQQIGHNVNLVTARPYAMAADTLTWLRTNGVPYGNILFNCDDKAAACNLVAADVMVDDAPFNLENLTTAGVNTVVFDQPYNTMFRLPRLTAWTSINDVVDAIDAALGTRSSTTSTS